MAIWRCTPFSTYLTYPYGGFHEWGIPQNGSKWLVYKCLWMFVVFYNGKSQSKYGWFRGTSISGNLHVETAWGPGKAKPAAKDQLQILVRKLTGKSNMAGKSFFKPVKNDDFMCLTYEKLWFHGNFMGFGWEIAWLNGGWKNFRRFKHAKIVRKNGGLSSLNHVIEQKKQYTVYSTLRNPGCIIIESLASKPVYSISYEPNQLFCW